VAIILMGGLGPLMNGPAISAIDGWAGPTIFSGPLMNGPYWRMVQNMYTVYFLGRSRAHRKYPQVA